MLQAILFDLDGTLLPMDNDYFVQVYFGHLARTAVRWGYTDSQKLIGAVWDGVREMTVNDGRMTNCEAFWNRFCQKMGSDPAVDIPRFSSFYDHEFRLAKSATHPTLLAVQAVRLARAKAKHVILATNPIFPRNADEVRLSWIGLKTSDFDLVTDYENCVHSKPNPEYYLDIIEQFSLDPSKCLMIGNNVQEDMEAAEEAGMSCFLLKDYMINRDNVRIRWPQGSYEEMLRLLSGL